VPEGDYSRKVAGLDDLLKYVSTASVFASLTHYQKHTTIPYSRALLDQRSPRLRPVQLLLSP